ncbi:unnamed protein product [marine sediment metagenome]|uniref:Uncharacterized protein n=1 Tax=marine sediment metagenome TaxID=412755 RepID=X0YEN6_9ZZZZ
MKVKRRLTRADVKVSLSAEYDEISPLPDEMGEKYCAMIRKRLDQGDVWAWAAVTVTATVGEFTESMTLHGCCYKDEKDFMQPNWYYDDMANDCVNKINAKIDRMVNWMEKESVLQ